MESSSVQSMLPTEYSRMDATFSPLSLPVQSFMSGERANPLRHESPAHSSVLAQTSNDHLSPNPNIGSHQQENKQETMDDRVSPPLQHSQSMPQAHPSLSPFPTSVHVHAVSPVNNFSQTPFLGISASTAVSSSATMLPPAIVRRANDDEQKCSSLLHGHSQFSPSVSGVCAGADISNQGGSAAARFRALAHGLNVQTDVHCPPPAVANRSFIDQNQNQTVSLTFIEESNLNHSNTNPHTQTHSHNNSFPRLPSPSNPSLQSSTSIPPLHMPQHFHHNHSHPYRPSSRSSSSFSALAQSSPRAMFQMPALQFFRRSESIPNGYSPEKPADSTQIGASMSPSESPLSSPALSACSSPSPQSPSRFSLCSSSLSFPSYHSFACLYAPILSCICHFLAPRDIASRMRSVSRHWRSVSFSALSWRCAALRVKSLDDLMNCLDPKKVPAMRALSVTLDTEMEMALEKMEQTILQLRSAQKPQLVRTMSESAASEKDNTIFSAAKQSAVKSGLLSLKELTLHDCSFVSPVALSHLRAFHHIQSFSFGRLDKASCESLFLALASFDFPLLQSVSISNSSLSLSSAHVCLRWTNTAPQLKTLSLEDVKGVGRALGVLAHMKGIETLRLAWNEDVTDSSIATLIHPPPPPSIDTKNGAAPFSPPGSPMLLAGSHRLSLSANNNANANGADGQQHAPEQPTAPASPLVPPTALFHSPGLTSLRERRQLSQDKPALPALCLSLRTLDLQTCKNLSSASMEHIAKLPELTDLDVGGTAIGNDGLGFLAAGNLVHTLIRLNLTHCENVADDGMKHLSKFKVLQELYLEKTSIRDRGIKFLCTHHATVARADPNRSPLAAYKRSPSFSAAQQHSTQSPAFASVSSPAAPAATGLPVLPFLHTLDLSCTMVTSAAFAALSLLPSLRSLNMSSTRLSSLYASAALSPSRFLCRFTTLTSLNVSWCAHLNILDIFFLVSHLPALIQINQSTFRPRAESEEEKKIRLERSASAMNEEEVEDDESDEEEDSDEGSSDVDFDSRSSDLFAEDPFAEDGIHSPSNTSSDTVVVKVPVNSLSKKIDRLMRKRRRIGADKLIARAKARFQFHALPSLPASPFFGAQTPLFNAAQSPIHSPVHSATPTHPFNHSFSANSAIPLLAM